MKIALISPFVYLNKNYKITPHKELNQFLINVYKNNFSRRPNLALLTLASYLDDTFEIDYIDEQYKQIPYDQYYDMVAISIMTVNAYHAYDIAKKFKEKGSYVILGGIHASLEPQEAKLHADTVIVGEAEECWQQFLTDFKANTPQPFYYGGNINLDTSPQPRYDLLPDDYFYNPMFKKHVFTFQYSRGCPHRCVFCASSKAYGTKYRTKKIDHFLKGIEKAIERTHGECMLFFADDDITIKKEVAKDLFDRIAEYKITWGGCADIAISDDPELLEKMQKAGCKGVIMGLESLDATTLESIDPFKAKYFKNYDESVTRVLEYGVPILASFIMGFDTDNNQTAYKIYEFVKKNKIPMTTINLLVPFPGTPILQQLKAQNRLLYENFWDKCSGVYPLFKPLQMEIDDLLDGLYWLTTQFAKDRATNTVRM